MILDTVKGVIALIVTVALVGAGVLGWQRWREIQRERHVVAEAMVAREAAIVAEVRDSLAGARAELDAALAAGRSVIASRTAAPGRRAVRTVAGRPSLIPRLLDPKDADSVRTTLRGIIGVQQRGLDSLEAQLGVVRDTLARIIVAAERYRLYAEGTIGAQARQISAMRVVIETPKPRRRWGLGGAGGYCAVHGSGPAARESLRYGAGVCAGVSFSF